MIVNGWLEQATVALSPNRDQRPEDLPVSLLVIHSISLPPGCYGGGQVADFFTNKLKIDQHPYFETIKDLKVSAHLFIDRQGGITQFVSFDERAWHAGLSCYEGRERCNDFSIGIELEGTDTESYTAAQYAALVAATGEIMATYPLISPQRIVGHGDISPGRKTDPGISFDWHYFLSQLGGAAL